MRFAVQSGSFAGTATLSLHSEGYRQNNHREAAWVQVCRAIADVNCSLAGIHKDDQARDVSHCGWTDAIARKSQEVTSVLMGGLKVLPDLGHRCLT